MELTGWAVELSKIVLKIDYIFSLIALGIAVPLKSLGRITCLLKYYRLSLTCPINLAAFVPDNS